MGNLNKRGSDVAWSRFIIIIISIVVLVLVFFAIPQFYLWAKDFFKNQGGSYGKEVVKVEGAEVIGYFMNNDEVMVYDGASFGSFPSVKTGNSEVELNNKKLNGEDLKNKFLDYYFFSPFIGTFKSRGTTLVSLVKSNDGSQTLIFLYSFLPNVNYFLTSSSTFLMNAFPEKLFNNLVEQNRKLYVSGGVALFYVAPVQGVEESSYLSFFSEGLYKRVRSSTLSDSVEKVSLESQTSTEKAMISAFKKWRDSVLVKPIQLEYVDIENNKQMSEYFCVKLFEEMGGKGPALVVDLTAPVSAGEVCAQ